MKTKSYTKICETSKVGKDIFMRDLKKYYGTKSIVLPLCNAQGDNFIIFKDHTDILEEQFNDSSKLSCSYRENSIEDYLTSGYIVSEINSSLRAEGVHSSRKIVDQVLKNKHDGVKMIQNEVERLIANYYEAMIFILDNKNISEKNINTLYSILTTDIEDDIIEEGNWYRQNNVSIGRDLGAESKKIQPMIEELVEFINSEILEDHIQTKALVAHYIFENIHPYYDFNGRMGRLLHLWVLSNADKHEFWKLTFLSETIYANKIAFDKIFRDITKAKKNKANIDLTYFVGRLFEIFIESNHDYVRMKKMVNTMKKSPSRHLRLFILDLLSFKGADGKYYTMKEFKDRYSDYSTTVYDRILKEIKESGLFTIRKGTRPTQFRLKK